jgi:hypothetical protein
MVQAASIVDEAHTCAGRKGGGRQQRYELLRGLAADPQRHLVLLTATPHSGDQEAFDNLLGLLDPKFEGLSEMPEGQRRRDLRDELGNYFVQRRRLSRVNPLGRFATTKLAGEGPQVVAGDNLGAATRKLSHPATRSLIGTGFS